VLKIDPSYSSIKRCMTHLEVLGVEPKIRQLVSMYLEMAYQEGAAEKMKDIVHK
jgi:hypothetical protein